MDVGGKRCERRKWRHGFEGADIVLFNVSIGSYGENPMEDRTQASTYCPATYPRA